MAKKRSTALERFAAKVVEDGGAEKAARRLGITSARVRQLLDGDKPGGKAGTAIQREYLIPVTEW